MANTIDCFFFLLLFFNSGQRYLAAFLLYLYGTRNSIINIHIAAARRLAWVVSATYLFTFYTIDII